MYQTKVGLHGSGEYFKSLEKCCRYKIAEAIWLPIYGESVYRNKPFVAKLKYGKVWIVEGTLHEELGGVPYIEIQKKDCKVLKMYHGK